MIVRTRALFREEAEAIWPRLCDSRMDERRPCLFRFGLPKPVACRLPSGSGGSGAERQCVSDQGTLRQRIVVWTPPRRLRFELVSTALDFGRHVESMVDEFTLEPAGPGATWVTRVSELRLRGGWSRLRAPAYWIGLKQIHRYVFENWAR